jgi:DNA-binding response OmpR family regulator
MVRRCGRRLDGIRTTAVPGVEDIAIDAVFRTVSRPNVGRTVLTGKEVQLISLLKNAPGNVLRRDDLLNLVWGGSSGAGKVFGVHLLSLRRKIAPLGLTIRFVAPDQYRLIAGRGGQGVHAVRLQIQSVGD